MCQNLLYASCHAKHGRSNASEIDYIRQVLVSRECLLYVLHCTVSMYGTYMNGCINVCPKENFEEIKKALKLTFVILLAVTVYCTSTGTGYFTL